MRALPAMVPQRREEAMPRILVLGYGNPGRRDDGLGPAVANAIAALSWPGVTTWENDQLAIEDALDVSQHDQVWFVDAAREGEEPFTAEPVSPAMEIAFTSHVLSPQTVLAIAAREFGADPEAHLLGIRGYDFSFAEGLSEEAERNLDLAVAFLRQRIAATRRAGP